MVKQYLTTDNVFMWNLTANVGRGQPNKLDDVELVRYGFFCMGFMFKSGRIPDLLPIIKTIDKMSTRGPYGPDLQAVIDQNQSELPGSKDGHVSTVKVPFASAAPPREGGVIFRIISLNGFMVERDSAKWPRIDQFVECGPTISKFVKDFFSSDFG